ncbi:hypothetical protein EDB87DRAFT_1576067 [Lactarius vividus]|nr:hypothetical protein EDB87DRAFT_1576067 [Lactarius vividus]
MSWSAVWESQRCGELPRGVGQALGGMKKWSQRPPGEILGDARDDLHRTQRRSGGRRESTIAHARARRLAEVAAAIGGASLDSLVLGHPVPLCVPKNSESTPTNDMLVSCFQLNCHNICAQLLGPGLSRELNHRQRMHQASTPATRDMTSAGSNDSRYKENNSIVGSRPALEKLQGPVQVQVVARLLPCYPTRRLGRAGANRGPLSKWILWRLLCIREAPSGGREIAGKKRMTDTKGKSSALGPGGSKIKNTLRMKLRILSDSSKRKSTSNAAHQAAPIHPTFSIFLLLSKARASDPSLNRSRQGEGRELERGQTAPSCFFSFGPQTRTVYAALIQHDIWDSPITPMNTLEDQIRKYQEFLIDSIRKSVALSALAALGTIGYNAPSYTIKALDEDNPSDQPTFVPTFGSCLNEVLKIFVPSTSSPTGNYKRPRASVVKQPADDINSRSDCGVCVNEADLHGGAIDVVSFVLSEIHVLMREKVLGIFQQALDITSFEVVRRLTGPCQRKLLFG